MSEETKDSDAFFENGVTALAHTLSQYMPASEPALRHALTRKSFGERTKHEYQEWRGDKYLKSLLASVSRARDVARTIKDHTAQTGQGAALEARNPVMHIATRNSWLKNVSDVEIELGHQNVVLARAALKLGLDKMLRIGNEARSDSQRYKILADSFEAVLFAAWPQMHINVNRWRIGKGQIQFILDYVVQSSREVSWMHEGTLDDRQRQAERRGFGELFAEARTVADFESIVKRNTWLYLDASGPVSIRYPLAKIATE